MMDDTNPFAPTAALPHTENPAEPPAAEDTQALPADATISPAVEKFNAHVYHAIQRSMAVNMKMPQKGIAKGLFRK